MPKRAPYRKQDKYQNEKQFARDFGSGLNDVIGRGTLAGLLGIPGDTLGLLKTAGVWANNKVKDFEYATGLLKAKNGNRKDKAQMPGYLSYPDGNAYGGAEDIGNRMEGAGLVSSVRRPKTELLASLISPAQIATASLKAPTYARNALRLLDNLEAPATMRNIGQRGAVDTGLLGKMVAPQDKALRVAQANAAKPVSEGGLGLRLDNTPEERASAMGFDVNMPLYHGTGADIQAFDQRLAGKNDRGLWGRGQYLATSPDSASSYALREGDGANVIPTYAAVKRPMQVTTGRDLITRMPDGADTRALIGDNLDGAKIKEIAQAAGHDGVFQFKPNGTVGDIVTYDPSTIRSRFAAFDPMRKDSSDLLAGLAPIGLGALIAQPKEKKKPKKQ